MCILESHSRLLFLASEKFGIEDDYGPVHSAYNTSFSACFFSRNSIFPSQQISQQCFFSRLISTAERPLYLNDHLEKLLEGSFSPKFLFLVFKKNMESLLEMLLYRVPGPRLRSRLGLMFGRRSSLKLWVTGEYRQYEGAGSSMAAAAALCSLARSLFHPCALVRLFSVFRSKFFFTKNYSNESCGICIEH
jgi:hypothetical protein